MIRKEYLPFGKPNFSDAEIEAVTRVLQSGWIGMGPETIAFEKELSGYIGVPHIVSVNSCTSALFLSLLIHGIGPGDEVVCPSLTWCSTANVVVSLGAEPVFCDVDPGTLCLTPETVRAKLTDKTKVVIIVHMGGLAVDVDEIRSSIPENIAIVEDAAHALGAKFANGKFVGSSGNLTCFSFYANKNLSTGEGGAIALFDEKATNRLQSLRQHGMPVNAWNRFQSPNALFKAELGELGYKMNYIDLQACIGRIQLKRQQEFNEIRLNISKHYYNHLSILCPSMKFQENIVHPDHARHLFIIQLPIEKIGMTRDQFLMELRALNVGACVHYLPLHLMPFYSRKTQVSLPNTEKLFKQMITLPISASMEITDAEYVVKQINELIKS